MITRKFSSIRKPGPCTPAGTSRKARSSGRGKRLAAGALDAEPLPFADRHPARAVGQQKVEIRRHHDLVAPGLAGDPAVLLQVVGGRGDDVGHRVDDVAAAVAVEVDGVALERRRHELRRPEGAGPGADQPVGADVAALEDFQRGEELVAEIALPPADAGERRGRADHRPVADWRCRNWSRRPRSRR